jgi:outer membrane protein, multidrug efflux system
MWTTAVATLTMLLNAMPEPLVGYLKAGREHNLTLQISRAQLAEQEAQVSVALSSLTPTVQITGAYQRNQYEALVTLPSSLTTGGTNGRLTTFAITPFNQINGTVNVNIPLVNPDGITRFAQGRRGAAASNAAEKATTAEVDLSIVRAYYQTVAAQGVLAAAQHALKESQDALATSQAKLAAGTANRLAVDRASVDVARANQTVAEAQRTLGLARRNLETLTGQPAQVDLPNPANPQRPAGSEEDYVHAAQQTRPEVIQAQESVAQASASRDEAWMQLVPSLNGFFTENLTNASGFIGHQGYWATGVKLSWNLDPVGTPAAVRKADAALLEQEKRLQQTLDTVRDEVHTSFLDIALDFARVDETTAEVLSAREALKLTQDQFAAGTATSLDLSQAERDAFQAEANNAQSAADLEWALLGLKKAAGEPIFEAAK